MIINSVKLRNIRSYRDAVVEFPEGIVLLSGDVGSGKSSILLALEFAVFGIMKGLVSGTSLLRHGAKQGFVELSFSLGKKDVVVRRSLKRSSRGVSQDSGFVRVNNQSFEGTAQELKARLLDLLGYPESLLSKSKSLIFRYTVYTPQEDMKRIIFERKEERLDILRRLFNIDKYKRAKDNCVDYARELYKKINFLEGRVKDLPVKKKELKGYEQELRSTESFLKSESEKLSQALKDFNQADLVFKKLEKELELLNKAEKELGILKSQIGSAQTRLKELRAEAKSLNSETSALQKELKGFSPEKAEQTTKKLDDKKSEAERIDKKLTEINSKKSVFETKKNVSKNIISKLKELDVCPTCEQKVTPEHIKKVSKREQNVINKCDANLEKLETFHKRLIEKKRAAEQEIELLRQEEKAFESDKARHESLEEKQKRKKELENQAAQLEKDLEKNQSSLEQVVSRLEDARTKKKELEASRKKVEEKREHKDELEKEVAKNKAKLETLNKVVDKLRKDVNNLKKDENKLEQLSRTRSWLQKDFVSLVDMIEKNVFARVFNEFNAFFQEWFNTLLEDETISVRLDEYFSPVIEQNGYETWLENLSGGEKTSIALAYRLALNKVINDFMSTIRTRDLLILDEPTDGFSSEQLDRVREVLGQVNVKQVLIVSHEEKMEGFVDSILRVKKHGHKSSVE